MNSEVIRIPLSKSKMVLLISGAIVLVLASGWLLYKVWALGEIFLLIVAGGISIIGILFFVFLGTQLFLKLFDNQPGLIITEEGIQDNSSGVSAGLLNGSI